MIHRAVFYLLAYLLLVVQTSPTGGLLTFSGIEPDFMLILVVLHCLEFEKVNSILFAFITGLMVDAFDPAWFGLNALAFVTVGYIVASISERIYKERLVNRIIFVFTMFFVRDLSIFIIKAGAGPSAILINILESTFYGALWTAIIAIPVIPLLDLVSGKWIFEKKQPREEE